MKHFAYKSNLHMFFFADEADENRSLHINSPAILPAEVGTIYGSTETGMMN